MTEEARGWASSSWKAGRPLQLLFYGDANGRARSSNSGGQSSGDIVQQTIRYDQQYSARMMQKTTNPAVQDRVNAMNAVLCSAADRSETVRRLYVDRSCQELLADLEEVKWKVDAHGVALPEIDKRDSKRTHVSDAVGYYVQAETSKSGSVARASNMPSWSDYSAYSLRAVNKRRVQILLFSPLCVTPG